jgi:glutamyl-tRNA reductase
MRFQLIGVNHKTAPVEVRERLAIPESRLPEACKRLSEHPSCRGHDRLHLQPGGIYRQHEERHGDLREFLREYFEVDLRPV